MNILLTPQLETLQLLEERDRVQANRLEELKAEIQKGFDSGEPTPLNIEEIKARGRKRLAAEKERAAV